MIKKNKKILNHGSVCWVLLNKSLQSFVLISKHDLFSKYVIILHKTIQRMLLLTKTSLQAVKCKINSIKGALTGAGRVLGPHRPASPNYMLLLFQYLLTILLHQKQTMIYPFHLNFTSCSSASLVKVIKN